MLKPVVIARIVASTDATTEQKPFTAQHQATNCSWCGVSPETARRPIGMNAPRQRPSGSSTAIVSATRSANGQPTPSSTSGVKPKR